jgi:TetR/AcrR family transcriptional repressor of nem operon
MRVSRERAEQNRRNILTVASRLFRERGIHATGVDAITEELGLTHGAVYSHFGSKEAIAVEAIRDALAGSAHMWRRLIERKGRKKAFPAIVAAYLSRQHRDLPGQGCIVAALAGEIVRQSERVRDTFTDEVKGALQVLTDAISANRPSRAYEDAVAAFAFMLGALILARAVSDEALSDQILKVAAKRVVDRIARRRVARRSHM